MTSSQCIHDGCYRYQVRSVAPTVRKKDRRAEFTYDCGRQRCEYLHEAMDVWSATFNRWNLFRALDPKEACTETSMVRPYPISLRVKDTFVIKPPLCPGQIYHVVPGRIILLSYCSLHDGGTSHPAEVALGSLTPTPTPIIKT
ncbi:Uncharacterized protein HZ326_5213 [Fusarium oxysporum f. sp. albedinis]|nr:Uncharacterized protein HZ326_5213 [Fusarium oxysporum f. sp. albedinis]